MKHSVAPESGEIEFLSWDSNFFQKKVGRLFVSNQMKRKSLQKGLAIGQRDFDVVYLFVSPDPQLESFIVSESGADLVDRKVTYFMNLSSEPLAIPSGITGYSHKDVDREIVFLALQSGVHSRFKMDTRFGVGKFEALYEEWISKSVAGEMARETLISTKEDNKVGVITLGEKNGRGDIGIFAVDESYRGMGIGKELMVAAKALFQKWGRFEIQVVTQQANISACEFYRRCGFQVEKVEHIYHLWKK